MRGAAFLYAIVLGLCAGMAFALLYPLISIAFGALICGALFLLFALTTKNKRAVVVAVLFASLAAGVARVEIYNYVVAQETLANFADEKIVAAGRVVNDPDVSGNFLHANIQVETINGAPARGALLAFLPPRTNMAYGDAVAVSGKLQTPQAFTGDNGNIFDYPGYLRVQGVSMTLVSARVVSQQPSGISLMGFLYGLKHAFDASIEKLLPEPDASLLEGILLGQRHGLPPAVEQAFVIAGLIHIVILSGYSMSVVSEGVLRGLFFLPARPRFIVGAVLMVLFVLMTGAAATTVRACTMALVALVARYFHRTAVALRSLAAVAAGMALVNPPMLLEDASFIVSVLATFGLIVFAPSVEKILRFVPEHFDARAILTSTLSVQIFALPILLYFTGTISILSLPANLLVLPLLPLVMLAGIGAGLLGFVSHPLALVLAGAADIVLKFILIVVGVVQLTPFSAATVTAFPLWAALLCYVPLTALAIWLLQKNALRTRSS